MQNNSRKLPYMILAIVLFISCLPVDIIASETNLGENVVHNGESEINPPELSNDLEPEDTISQEENNTTEIDNNDTNINEEAVDIQTPDQGENEPSADEESDDKDACTAKEGMNLPDDAGVNSLMAVSGRWIQAKDGRWWYKHSNGTYTKNGWEKISGKWYYFDAAGWMKTGWVKVSGNWYYLNSSGAMQTGWLKLGDWFYTNSKGVMLVGWQQINYNGELKWFHFIANGVLHISTWSEVVEGHTKTHNTAATKYASYVTAGAAVWNAHKAGVIRKDTAATVRDVEIIDKTTAGTADASTFSNGKIECYTNKMDNYSDAKKKHILIHELGHTLGLGHNCDDDVMCVHTNTKITLTTCDKQSYNAAYKKY